jgi:hypothetical protein
MTELIQNHQLTDEEGVRATAALDGAACHAPALPASSSTPQNIDSSDEVETRWSLRGVNNGTPASPADRVESPPAEDVNEINAQPYEVCTPDMPPPLPFEPDGVIGELHDQIKRVIVGRTNLPNSVAGLLAFWAISTWFQEAFIVNPCLVITGNAHEALVILRVLRDLCRTPTLLAGFKRGDLKTLTGHRTLLISEPNLDNRTAALLGNLTNRDFMLVEQGSYLCCASSKAIYIGEDPTIKRIQHSLYINATTPPHVDPPVAGQALSVTIDSLRNRLLEYRNRNLGTVRSLEFNPRGLSLEAHAMANALGSCVVDEPQLESELVTLLKPQHQQQIADRSSSLEAIVAGVALAFCHQGKDEVYVKEVAAEVNRLLVARGETMQLSAEKAGHKLRKAGLFTRRLSPAGNGLTLDQATRSRVHEVARAYLGEDSISDTENLHCQQCSQNERYRKAM